MLMKKLIPFLSGILVTILIIFILWYTRNFVILNSLNRKAQETSKIENYTIQCTSYADTTYSIAEAYYMKNKSWNVNTTYYTASSQTPSSIKVYKDQDSAITLYTRNETTSVKLAEEPFGRIAMFNPLENQNLFSLALQNISREMCNGKDCYSLCVNNIRYWIDNETGLTIRILNLQEYSKQHSAVLADYQYTFNHVTDENIVKPDISNYTILP